jgi:hypothetical protein
MGLQSEALALSLEDFESAWATAEAKTDGQEVVVKVRGRAGRRCA